MIHEQKKKRRAFLVTPTVRARIRQESQSLHLKEHEYLDLVSQLAAAIRQSVLPDGTDDPKLLYAAIDNPLLLSMVSAMAGTIWSSVKSSLEEPSADTPPPQTLQPAKPQPPTMYVIDPITGKRLPFRGQLW